MEPNQNAPAPGSENDPNSIKSFFDLPKQVEEKKKELEGVTGKGNRADFEKQFIDPLIDQFNNHPARRQVEKANEENFEPGMSFNKQQKDFLQRILKTVNDRELQVVLPRLGKNPEDTDKWYRPDSRISSSLENDVALVNVLRKYFDALMVPRRGRELALAAQGDLVTKEYNEFNKLFPKDERSEKTEEDLIKENLKFGTFR